MPSQPTLSLSALSGTSFQATVSGDAGVTNQIYFRDIARAAQPDQTGPSFTGNGSATVTGLNSAGQYMAWCQASLAGALSAPAIGFVSLAGPTTLLNAAVAKFQGAAALTSLFPGGVYANEAPETVEGVALSLPWAIMMNRRTRFEWVQNVIFYEVSDLELTLFCPGAASAEACLAAVRSVFDWSQLSFADGVSSSTYVQPLRYEIASEPVRYRDGTLVYTADLAYECWVNRSNNFPT